MDELSFLARSASWFSGSGEDADVAVSSRVRLSRNLADFAYPGHRLAPDATIGDAAAASDRVCDVVRAELMPEPFDAEALEIEPPSLDPAKITGLRERRLVDREVPHRLFVSRDESMAIAVGAEDHVRIAAFRAGIAVEEALRAAAAVDRKLEASLNFAVSLDLGYLSTSITNLGTALRVSVLVHLPALVMHGRIDDVQRSMRSAGLDLIPDEQFTPDEGEAAVFRLSNRRTLGQEEGDLVSNLEDHTRALVHYERNAREEAVQKHGPELSDAAYRALGTLRYARRLNADEALALLSTVRVGVIADLVGGVTAGVVTSLFFLSRDSHVRATLNATDGVGGDGEENIQLARAHLVREALRG